MMAEMKEKLQGFGLENKGTKTEGTIEKEKGAKRVGEWK